MLTTVPAPRPRPAIAVTPDLAIGVPPKPEEVSRVRHAVHSVLVQYGLDRHADDALLVTTELLTNAMHHAPCSRIWLYCTRDGDLLLIEVEDGSASPPVLRRSSSAGAESGRGLHLVQALTADWGWTPKRGGTKRTWAVLELRERADAGPAA